MQRLRSAVKISYDKTKYEKYLDCLRSDLADLRAIRSYKDRPLAREDKQRTAKKLPKHVSNARRACIALYDALVDSWSCANPAHLEHAAKLCLETKVDDGVRLDLALACTDTSPPLWLYVRSLTNDPPKTLGPNDLTQIVKPTSAAQKPPICCDRRPIKRQRLDQPAAVTMMVARDLRRSPSFCDSLAQCQCQTRKEECLGFVESSQPSDGALKHMFYHRCDHQPSVQSTTQALGLTDLFAKRQQDTTLEHQLYVAYTLATAVLQLHTTPWLPDEWRTRNISSFEPPGKDLMKALETLHVTTGFRPRVPAVAGSEPMQATAAIDVLQTPDQLDAQCIYGVSNIVLFSLGIALLEVSHGKPLESFRSDRGPNDIVTARRLAQRPTMLGQKYQRIAQRCLQCDFGFGSDLDKEDLQGAVYGDVVCQLGEMLEGFKI